MKRTFTLLTVLVLAPFVSFAESYTLQYQKSNHWVAQDDAKSLRAFLKAAKEQKADYFMVALPDDTDRNTSIERLIVLRDILEGKLKTNIVLEEELKDAPTNSLVVSIKK
ncbi:MAG: hypothetical protein VX730_08145 [Pseudomonadota bacterium]|nr:hypothetical protein [Pseudomonadota bacterium]